MQLYPGLFVMTCPFGQGRTINISLFSGERRLLVDSGMPETPERCILPALRELGLSAADLDLLICLHAHEDHMAGNATLWAASGRKLCIGAQALDAPVIGKRWGAEAPVHVVYQGGEVVDLGGLEIEVLHAPGHTPGNLTLFDRAHSTLVHGESVMGTMAAGAEGLRTPWQLGAEPLVYRRTLEQLRVLPFERFVPSHEPVMDRQGGLARIDAALAQLDAFETHVRAALDARRGNDGDVDVAGIAAAVAAAGRYQPGAEFERQVASVVQAWERAAH